MIIAPQNREVLIADVCMVGGGGGGGKLVPPNHTNICKIQRFAEPCLR